MQVFSYFILHIQCLLILQILCNLTETKNFWSFIVHYIYIYIYIIRLYHNNIPITVIEGTNMRLCLEPTSNKV